MEKHIKGYVELTETEIELLEEVKAKTAELGALIDKLRKTEGLDQRWVSIGATDWQTGSMALERSITRPATF